MDTLMEVILSGCPKCGILKPPDTECAGCASYDRQRVKDAALVLAPGILQCLAARIGKGEHIPMELVAQDSVRMAELLIQEMDK